MAGPEKAAGASRMSLGSVSLELPPTPGPFLKGSGVGAALSLPGPPPSLSPHCFL